MFLFLYFNYIFSNLFVCYIFLKDVFITTFLIILDIFSI